MGRMGNRPVGDQVIGKEESEKVYTGCHLAACNGSNTIFMDRFVLGGPPNPGDLTIRAVTDLSELNALKSAWAGLLSDASRPAVFLSWDWIANWWRLFGEDHNLWLLLAYDGEWLVGLLPLMVQDHSKGFFHWRTLSLVTAKYGADHLDMLVRRGYEEVAPGRILQEMLDKCPKVDIIELTSLDEHGLCAQGAAKVSRRWRVEKGEPCPYIGLADSWEEYARQGLSKRMDRKLRSSSRRAVSDLGSTMRIWRVKNERERAMALDSLFNMHCDKWDDRCGKTLFADPRLQEFHHEMSRILLKCGCLRMFVLSVGQNIVAVEYDIHCRDVNYSFQKSFSPVWKEYLPGYLLTQFAVQDSIRKGMTEFDLLRGDEPYKKYWATGHRYDLSYWMPTTVKGWLVWQLRLFRRKFLGVD